MSAERGGIGDPQPSVEWRDSHYSRQADRVNADLPVPSTPPSGPPLRIADRYAARRKHG
jgi:hypothetical protein